MSSLTRWSLILTTHTHDTHLKPLPQIVKSTLKANPGNSVIGFKDNSSAIRGGPVTPLLPLRPGGPSPLEPQASAAAAAPPCTAGVGRVRRLRCECAALARGLPSPV